MSDEDPAARFGEFTAAAQRPYLAKDPVRPAGTVESSMPVPVALEDLRREGSYAGARAMLDALVFLEIVAIVALGIFWASDGGLAVLYGILGAAALVVVIIILRALYHAIFDIADRLHEAAGQRRSNDSR